MKVIVIGMGEVGKHIAKVLVSENHDVTIVDRNAQQLARAEQQMDVMSFRGHGASLRVLEQTKVATADLAIAVTNNDEVNMLAASTAKKKGARRVVGRVKRQDLFDDRGQASYKALLGIDLVINEQVLTAIEIQRLIKTMGAIAVEYFADNRVEMIQLPVGENFDFLNKPLRDVELPNHCVVAGILRGDRLIVPGGEDSIQQGDEVFLIGTLESIPSVEKLFGRVDQRSGRKVIIVGGGEFGFAVAELLEEDGVDVVLLDSDKARCIELAKRLDHTVIIHGDGTDLALLREEKVENCDVFVAVSGDDEANLMSSLLAKHLGANKTVALVDKPDYAELYEALGVDATISPRLFAAKRVLKYVRQGEVVSATRFGEGKAEILEIVPAEGSRIVNKALKDVNFPKGAIVTAVSNEGEAFVPRGDDRIAAGSVVVVFTVPKARPAVEKLFRKGLFSF